MNCPACGTKNKANAPFCIECGEPLELNNAPELGGGMLAATAIGSEAAPRIETAPNHGPFGGTPDRSNADDLPFPKSMIGWIPRPFNPLFWGWEIRLTVLVLLAAIFADWLIQGNAHSEFDEYQRGVKAYTAQQWHEAERLLNPLALKDYQQAQKYYAEASDKVIDFDAYYSRAQSARFGGSLMRAAIDYRNAYEIEPAYSDVAKWLTDTLATAGQILYQKDDGLYLADATGKPLAALPNSDKDTQVLAISDDHKLLCYTGSSNGQRKVYVRDMLTGATESFADLPPMRDESDALGYDFANFINGGKGLLLVEYQFTEQHQFHLFYFDVAANASPRDLGMMRTIAWRNSEPYIYFVPLQLPSSGANWYADIAKNTKLDATTLISYDANTESANVVAQANGEITQLVAGGKQDSGRDERVLYYVAIQNKQAYVYSTMADSRSSKLLLNTLLSYFDETGRLLDISTSLNSTQAILVKRGNLDEGGLWLLQPSAGKALDLRDSGWSLLTSGLGSFEYSHDGTKVLVQGWRDVTHEKSWFAVVNANLDLDLRHEWLNIASDSAHWLDKEGNYFYTVSNKGFSVIEVSSGKTLVNVAVNLSKRRNQHFISLPYKNTLMYAANEGIFISDVDGRSPVFLIPGATAAWLIPAK